LQRAAVSVTVWQMRVHARAEHGATIALLRTAALRRPNCDAGEKVWVGKGHSACRPMADTRERQQPDFNSLDRYRTDWRNVLSSAAPLQGETPLRSTRM
jgi:hypothetical protein